MKEYYGNERKTFLIKSRNHTLDDSRYEIIIKVVKFINVLRSNFSI